MTITTDVTWRRLREMVKKRDKSTCFHCGEIDENGHCDHLMPLAKGGTDSIMNLVWACKKCNFKKSDKFSFDDGTMPPWVVKEETPVQSKWSKIDNEVDNFVISLLSLILKKLVPPYPQYTWPRYANYREYFFRIIIERITSPITTVLRQLVYPMPAEIKEIYDAFDRLREFEKYLVKNGRLDKKRIGIGGCPVCEANLFGSWTDNKDKSMTLNWYCPNGHKGQVEFDKGSHYIDNLYNVFIAEVYDKYYSNSIIQFGPPIVAPFASSVIHSEDYQI